MAFQQRDFSFGDFDTLSQEEQDRVYHILHGPKEALETRVEFPWDDCSDQIDFSPVYEVHGQVTAWVGEQYQGQLHNTCFPPDASDPHMQNPACGEMGFHISGDDTVMPDTQHHSDIQYSSGDSGIMMCSPGGGVITVDTIQYQSFPPQGFEEKSIMDDSGLVEMDSNYDAENKSRLQSSMRSLGRRNKKKRPADYYKRLESQDDMLPDDLDDLVLTEVVVDKNMSRYQSSSSYREGSVDSSQEGQTSQSEYFQNTEVVPSNVDVAHSDMYYSGEPHCVHQSDRINGKDYLSSGGSQQQYKHEGHFPQEYIYMQSNTKDNFTNESTHSVQNSAPPVSQMYANSHELTVNSTLSPTNVGELEMAVPTELHHDGQYATQPSYDKTTQNYCETDENIVAADIENLTLSQSNRETCVVSSTDSEGILEPVNAYPNTSESYQSEEKPDESDVNVNITTDTSPVTPVFQPVKPKTSSYAELFKCTTTAAKSIVVYSNRDVTPVAPVVLENKTETIEPEPEMVHKPVSASEDNVARQLGELLSTTTILHKPVALQPRGLINKGNWCYINATLQALIACPPFYNLLKKLPIFPANQRGPSSTPILDSLAEFINEFYRMHRQDKSTAKSKVAVEIQPGTHFEPSYVYKMLQVIADNPAFKLGKQEDAEEFLGCILNGMHEEMSASIKLVSNEKDTPDEKQPIANGFFHEFEDKENQSEEEDSWEQVGPKRKSVLTRKADFANSPIADIFAGYIRSAVFKVSSKESATLQPFFTLQLDIQSEKVWTVKDALEGLVSKESVVGFTCSKTNTEMEVSRKITLEQLPPVLILHLKCFVYDKSGGCQKLMKKVDYSVELEITKDLLSPTVRSKLNLKQRSYKLFAVVYHHGKNATGGHYTTSSYQPGINGWIHIDDNIVKTVNLQHVMKYSPPRVPYLLYYRRVDIH